MRKAIIIILIATITVVTSFTTVINFSFAEAQDKNYYYFETQDNIYSFGINQVNKYYIHDFTTPKSFVIQNGDFTINQIKDMINNNAIFEQRLLSTDGLFTYDIKLYLKNDSFSFATSAYAYKYSYTDTDGNDTILAGEPIAFTGVAVKVEKIEIYVSYNDYYLDINYTNSDSFFRTYNNAMSKNKYWSINDYNYGFSLANAMNIVDFSAIESDFFLNVQKDAKLINDDQELTDATMFIYPFSLEAGILNYSNFISDIFGNIKPINTNKFFNTDTKISGYVNIDGIYIERSAKYVGINEVNNKQIWKFELPITIDVNTVETLEFCARNNSWLSSITTTIIPLPSESIIINNSFSWGSLLELNGIFGVAVDLILQILNYEILGIELGFIIFAPLLFTLSLDIIRRIRG